MNTQGEKLPAVIERENALLEFVNRQAQEAILNPNLPDSYKNEVLNAAIGTIQKVAEKKAVYYAKYGEGRRKKPHIVYEAGKHEEEEREDMPPIISEINEYLKETAPDESKDFTVQGIAEKIGISQNILYDWVQNDSEFSESFERLKDVQKNDPFKTGTEEDTYVNSMMIAFLLMETRERHYKAGNL